jgi:hypothetical protein
LSVRGAAHAFSKNGRSAWRADDDRAGVDEGPQAAGMVEIGVAGLLTISPSYQGDAINQ